MNKSFWIYLAGLIDGDGCFTISMSTSRGKSGGISLSPHIRIAIKENDARFLEEMCDECGYGKIYYSNKGKPNGICSWQTTNISDSLSVAQRVYPFLHIKKDKCKKFIDISKYYRNTFNPKTGYRKKDRRLRKNKEMKKIIKVACELNYDRQTNRYRNKKGFDYWSKLIDEWYPD